MFKLDTILYNPPREEKETKEEKDIWFHENFFSWADVLLVAGLGAVLP